MDILQLDAMSDLRHWAAAIEAAEWDDGNAIDEPYSADSLARYLSDPKNVMVVAHDDSEALGMASGCVLRKPYGDQTWFYVDEVDVAVPHRRRGVGRALMDALLRIAAARDCDEVWLGTEQDNIAAAALYRSMEGEEEAVLGYTFEL